MVRGSDVELSTLLKAVLCTEFEVARINSHSLLVLLKRLPIYTGILLTTATASMGDAEKADNEHEQHAYSQLHLKHFVLALISWNCN